jgi:dihydropyrimidinase
MESRLGQANPGLDLVVTAGEVVLPGEERVADIGIRDGRIAAIGEAGSLRGARTISADGLIVLPGGIDPHTHVQWPLANGNSAQDTFETATARAASWGTTTIIDFVPATQGSLLRAADARLEQASQSVIDYSLHPIVTSADQATLTEVPELVDRGMSSFKVYTTYDHRLESADIRRFVRTAAEAGGLPGFHAEHHALLEDALDAVRRAGNLGTSAFPGSRPGHTESASIREVTGYAAEFDSPVYIYHASGLDALHEIERARLTGVDVRAETCAHYLALDDSVYSRSDGWKFVITPPIRTADDRAGMWRAVADARLNGVASDHCAYSIADKRAGFTDFTAMEPGAPGVASRMPMLWQYGVASGRLSLGQFARINSELPAAALGLRDKGRIAVGADADLVLWDPDAAWTWGEDGNNGADYDIYDGVAGRGRPRTTLSRGRVVHGDGAASTSTRGSFVPQRIR